MSAFIVTEVTMHKVVAGIIGLTHGNTLKFNGEGYSVFDTAAIKETGNAIGRALYAMNCDGVNARYNEAQTYGKDYVFDIKYEVMKRDYRGALLTAHHMKQVGCLLYQCSEGNVPETALFKELESIEGNIAKMIVSRLPEYDNAAWGD